MQTMDISNKVQLDIEQSENAGERTSFHWNELKWEGVLNTALDQLYSSGINLVLNNGATHNTSPDNEKLEIVVGDLIRGLWDVYQTMEPEQWNTFTTQHLLEHPIFEIVKTEPMTKRCLEKPRGYAGDAVMIDYIYESSSIEYDLQNASPMGKAIYDVIIEYPSSRAVRFRRDYVAKLIDEKALEVDKPDILSVACGHLREADKSLAFQNGKLGVYTALDQDQESLDFIEQRYPNGEIDTLCMNIRKLIMGREVLQSYDFIYASGLYDYLSERVAARLSESLFKSLKPGGTLVIGNFKHNHSCIGFMESFMDWRLINRSEGEMAELVNGIDREEILDLKTFTEENETIVFLVVTKK
ncbi:MAG: class I SAM-dependent methyltransferase [Leptospirales bacterium]